MKLTVGEVAKVLGISSENIRYYIREGLISPEKNDDNNYREYSSEYVCMSFYINLNDENPELQKYISLEETGSTAEKNHGIEDIECIDNMCLITKVHISDDMHEMIDPLLEYARLHNFRLTGEIYGKEQTNYYIDYKRHWVCTLYAPIE